MKKNLLLLPATLLAFSVTSTANAQDYISLGIGYYDVFDSEEAVDFRLEYRPDVPVLVDELTPWVGGEATTDGSLWAGGGLIYGISVNEQWSVSPSFGAGLYVQGGSDLDLGHAIEFRSQVEANYEFQTGQRAGVALSHLSNLGLDKENPGTKALSLYWHIPY